MRRDGVNDGACAEPEGGEAMEDDAAEACCLADCGIDMELVVVSAESVEHRLASRSLVRDHPVRFSVLRRGSGDGGLGRTGDAF